MNPNNSIFEQLDRLRLPLIIMVIFIHAQFSVNIDGVNPYAFISYLFTSIISSVAVPLFFFISGCLYFRNYKSFSYEEFLKKLKRRLKTLVLPFLIWNAFFWIVFTIFQLFVPTMLNGGIPSLYGASFNDYIWAFWGSSAGGPIDFPLWFIRDLITVSVLAPILYYAFIKYQFGSLLFIVLIILWICEYPIILIGNNICISLTFFTMGGMACKLFLKESNHASLSSFSTIIKSSIKESGGKMIILLWIVLCLVGCINHFWGSNHVIAMLLNKLIIIMGIISMFCIVEIFSSSFDKFRKRIPGNCVFFIFASHGFLITLIKRFVEKMSLNSQLVLIGLYFSIVIVTFAICFFLYAYMQQRTPKILYYLTGRNLHNT